MSSGKETHVSYGVGGAGNLRRASDTRAAKEALAAIKASADTNVANAKAEDEAENAIAYDLSDEQAGVPGEEKKRKESLVDRLFRRRSAAGS